MAEAQSTAKRKRGSSTGPDEEWRDVGLEVTKLLLLVGTTRETLALADEAHGRLVARADTMRWLLLNPSPGAAAADLPAVPDDDPVAGIALNVALMLACREIARASAMHRVAGRLFALYGAHRGLQGDPRWQSWERHRADAVGFFGEAVARVISAMSHLDAGREVLVAAPFPVLTPPFEPYGQAVGQIARRARDEAADALAQVRRMRDAVVLEFFDAWAVLSR